MFGDKENNQEGGNNSTNLQGQSIVINQGISYSDAKDIALDVFKTNFIELSEKAASTAKQRAEELVDGFLTEIQQRNPNAINEMQNPGMQYALFSAQKEYAKTGDKDLSDMLVDILVERASQTERNLKQIVLDESLLIVPKLTANQLDTLTIIFNLKYTRNFSITNHQTLKTYLMQYIAPFMENLSKETSLFQHLEFTGCSSISLGSNKIEQLFLSTYKGIFCKGFTKEQFESNGLLLDKFKSLICPCINNSAKLQLAVIDDEVLEDKAKHNNFTFEEINQLKPFFNNYQMNLGEIKDKIKEQGEYLTNLFDIWDNSSLKNMTLTSVGIAIATANLRRKTGITLDLGIWIK